MSVKNIKARGYITLVRIKDGEKGDRGDTGPKGDNGRDADFYRLRPLAEFANVDADGTLYVGLSYGADHIVGNTVTAQSLKATGLTVEARGNNNDYPRVEMTAGDVASGFTYIPDYVNASNRSDFFIVELKRGAQILDVKTVSVAMYAASYVKVVGDMRTSVSQQGKDISVIKQNAQSLTLRVDSLKTGIRNLLTGGKYERTFRGYGFTYNLQKGKYIKLEAEKDYTLTVCGRISQSTKDKGQLLHFYVFTPNWTWCDHIEISNVTDSIASVKFRIPAGKKTSDDMYIVDGYPFPNKDESGGNGEVTVNWVTITEGTQPASDWIPSKEESGEERVKAVELKLENGEFRIMSNRTVFVDNSGNETVLIKDGKLSANLIDAKKIVTNGLQAGDIDAQNATIKNLTVEGNSVFKGRLEGTSGSFTDLTCVDDKGQVVAGLHFSPDGKMVFDGDISSQGGKTINGRSRSLRYYASDIWCRGQFGHYSRICAVIKDNMMFVHHGGHEYTNGVKIKLASTRTRDGREVYLIPLYSPGLPSAKRNGEEVVDYDNPKIYELYSNSYGRKIAEELELPAGASIDVVVFNCTSYHLYNFVGMGYGKQWTVINGNDNVEAWICCHGSDFKVDGGWNLNCCYINPDWLTPSTVDRNSLGAGVMVGKELDMNW